MKKLGQIFLAAMAVAPSAGAAADSCDVEQALLALETDVVGSLTQEQRSDARQILNNLCGTIMIEESTVQASAADNASDKASDTEEDNKALFGIEFRRADEDSKGHDRLKKR